MFILLIFLTLKSGMIEVRHSTVNNLKVCQEAIPLYEKLYLQGKFYDGPPVETIVLIDGRCEKI